MAITLGLIAVGAWQTDTSVTDKASNEAAALATIIDRIVVAEIYARLNILIDLRRLRLESVTAGLPAPLYWVVLIGGLINISITWCFVMEKTLSHVFLSGLIGALIGLSIFMVAAMDNPFRGEYSVSPGAFEIVFDRYFSN